MVKVSLSSDSAAITRRTLLTGAVASTSALVLAACGGTSEAGPVPTVTRVPAEGAPPTPTPAPPPGATPAGGEATPADGAATPEAGAVTPEAGAATPAAGDEGAAVGPLIAFDIGWELNGARTPTDEITLTVTPGTTFELVSEGAADHDFTVDELSIHVPVAPGETVEVTIPEDAAPGEYRFYCSVPGHAQAGMVGTLVVQEAAAAPAAAEESAAPENAPATQEAAEAVGPLIAFDIGWELDGARTPTDAITLTVTPGITFELVSEGAAEHDFTVDELSVHVPVAPGETVEVTIPEDAAPGEYEFYCSVPGHRQAGMFGTLVVQEAGAAPAPADETAASEEAPATAEAAAEAVGPLIAFDIGWELNGARTPTDAITLTVSPGTTFDMVSEGAAEHDFTVDELSVHVPVAAGETVQVTIPEDAAPGEYRFYCSVPGHEAAGMVGTLVVE